MLYYNISRDNMQIIVRMCVVRLHVPGNIIISDDMVASLYVQQHKRNVRYM